MHNLKKKILLCMHNPFAIDNFLKQIKNLSIKYDVTIITTNSLLTSSSKKKYENLKKKSKIKNIYFLPFYKDETNIRDIKSLFLSHFFLKNLEKKLNFKKFNICLSDGKFNIWQKIILEKFLSKECIQIGLTVDAVLLPLNRFKQILDGKNVRIVLKNIHKLRDESKIRIKENNIIKKMKNVYNRYIDIFFDRILLSKLIYKRSFRYGKMDMKLMETNPFNYKITLTASAYIFWEKFYKKKVFLVNLENSCRCKLNLHQKKKKILFISGNIWHLHRDKKYSENINFLNNNIDKKINLLFKNIDYLKKNNPEIDTLDFRHHPEVPNEVKKYINFKLLKTKKLKFNINISDDQVPLQDISCNYKLAFGMISGGLFYLNKSCTKIKVYSFRSMNDHYWGKYYFLKFLNEDIHFINDLTKKYKKEKKHSYKLNKVKTYDLIELLELILKKKIGQII